jgi:GNAT superfamily N-acetyltransferase
MPGPRARPPYVITTDVSRFDLDRIWEWLSGSYWATGIPRGLVDRSLRGALCFGILRGKRQVGLARVITDRATFAYLADVFVDEAARGRGLARWLMRTILAHPDLQGLRRWLLATRDAHRLYAGAGFRPLAHPEWFMEITRPGLYQARAARVRSRRRASRASG